MSLAFWATALPHAMLLLAARLCELLPHVFQVFRPETLGKYLLPRQVTLRGAHDESFGGVFVQQLSAPSARHDEFAKLVDAQEGDEFASPAFCQL